MTKTLKQFLAENEEALEKSFFHAYHHPTGKLYNLLAGDRLSLDPGELTKVTHYPGTIGANRFFYVMSNKGGEAAQAALRASLAHVGVHPSDVLDAKLVYHTNGSAVMRKKPRSVGSFLTSAEEPQPNPD